MNKAQYRRESERELHKATKVGQDLANYYTQRALVWALLALSAPPALIED